LSPAQRQFSAVVLIALVPRVIAAIALGSGFHFPDEAAYADAARSLLGGDGWGEGYRRVPGYPMLLALLGLPAPGSVGWIRVAQAIVTSLGAGLVLLAAGRLAGPKAGVPAALIYALDPLMVVAAGLLYPEAAAAVLMLATVLLIWEAAQRDSPLLAVVAGSALGALALLRPVALAVVPVGLLWLLGAGPTRPARRGLHAVLAGLACVLVLAPWTYRNYRMHGNLVPISTAGAQGELATARQIDQRGLLGALAHKVIAEPGAVAAHVAGEFIRFWELAPSGLQTDQPDRRAAFHERDPRLPARATFPRTLRNAVSAASFGVELLLALAGFILLWRERRREAVLLAAVVLVYALATSLFYGKLRYRITVLPLVFLFGGAAAAAVFGAIRRRHKAEAPRRNAGEPRSSGRRPD
jgi:4-amino-4-deoxy-L-arabinose transferase-like glycosyltransferase